MTTFGGQTIPPLFGGGGGGGGDFTNPPLSFTGYINDIQLIGLGGTADVIVRFRGSGAIPNTTQGLLQQTTAAASLIPAPNQPNWHSLVGAAGNPDSGLWAVSLINIDFIDNVA